MKKKPFMITDGQIKAFTVNWISVACEFLTTRISKTDKCNTLFRTLPEKHFAHAFVCNICFIDMTRQTQQQKPSLATLSQHSGAMSLQ